MKDNISLNHSNRQLYNWRSYVDGDKCLLSVVSLYKGRLYDLGSGESPYKNFFLQYADEYIAVDWASSYHNVKVDIEADLNKSLPVETEVADTVVSLMVLEHLCEPQIMLNEAYRILKPGGAIVLQVPWQWRIHEAPYDYFRYTPYGLEYMLKKAGYKSIEVRAQSGFFTMWVTKFNYFSLRLIRGPRLAKFTVKLALAPIWFIGQIISPWLDKLDKNWAAEAGAYFVTAFKGPVDGR